MATTLATLNASDRADFVAALGHLFEHSPWIVEETWPQRPFASAEALYAAFCATMRAAPRDAQLALIRAHPDLAGRLMQLNRLTASSTREQATAGLDRLTEAELAEFTRQNDAYKVKFGIPFVICARLNAKDTILAAMRTRSSNSLDTEFNNALVEIEKIAQLRLQDVLGTTNPR